MIRRGLTALVLGTGVKLGTNVDDKRMLPPLCSK